MKKIFFVVCMLAVVMFSAKVTVAETTHFSKTFVGKGTFQVYVPFCFVAPWGNSNLVQTYQFQKGWPPLNIPSKWALVKQGELMYKGFYRFVSPKSYLEEFTIEGDVDISYENWQALEIEPTDVGMFIESHDKPCNSYRLPTNDKTASYFLLMSNPGRNITLGGILKGDPNFIWMAGKLYGVITSDSRGFLQERLTGAKLKNDLDKILVRGDSDVIVLEYRDEYK